MTIELKLVLNRSFEMTVSLRGGNLPPVIALSPRTDRVAAKPSSVANNGRQECLPYIFYRKTVSVEISSIGGGGTAQAVTEGT